MNRYSKLAGAFLAAFLAAAPAASAQGLSPELQKQAVALRVIACLSDAATHHDDGVSDVNDVAVIIAPMCNEAFAQEEAVFGAGLSPSSEKEYRAIMAKNRVRLAAAVVAQTRQPDHASPYRAVGLTF